MPSIRSDLISDESRAALISRLLITTEFIDLLLFESWTISAAEFSLGGLSILANDDYRYLYAAKLVCLGSTIFVYNNEANSLLKALD